MLRLPNTRTRTESICSDKIKAASLDLRNQASVAQKSKTATNDQRVASMQLGRLERKQQTLQGHDDLP
eukprot:6690542-Alexandrium_andersonii.AAC.1